MSIFNRIVKQVMKSCIFNYIYVLYILLQLNDFKETK